MKCSRSREITNTEAWKNPNHWPGNENTESTHLLFIKWKGGHLWGSKLLQEVETKQTKNKIKVTFMIKAS